MMRDLKCDIYYFAIKVNNEFMPLKIHRVLCTGTAQQGAWGWGLSCIHMEERWVPQGWGTSCYRIGFGAVL